MPRRIAEDQVDIVVFAGIAFRRYPNSETWAERHYYTPGSSHRYRGIGRLHQEIWKAANGPIPEGHDVHHVDGDTLNNDLGNLQCLPEAEHLSHHAANFTPEHLEKLRANLDAIRELASEWHRSPEGIAWHSGNAKKIWEGRTAERFTCDQCGSSYETRDRGKHRFCSNKCKSRWRRASGVDNIQVPCAVCGKLLTKNKYAKTKCCPGVCAGRHQSRTKLARLQPGDERAA